LQDPRIFSEPKVLEKIAKKYEEVFCKNDRKKALIGKKSIQSIR
jgi:hypothetical protein